MGASMGVSARAGASARAVAMGGASTRAPGFYLFQVAGSAGAHGGPDNIALKDLFGWPTPDAN